MGQKIDLKNSVEDVDGFKTNSLYFNESMASFGDICTVTFSWTVTFFCGQRYFQGQISSPLRCKRLKNPDLPYNCYESLDLRWTTASLKLSFVLIRMMFSSY